MLREVLPGPFEYPTVGMDLITNQATADALWTFIGLMNSGTTQYQTKSLEGTGYDLLRPYVSDYANVRILESLEYSRDNDEWLTNQPGSTVELRAVEYDPSPVHHLRLIFCQHATAIIRKANGDVIEEITATAMRDIDFYWDGKYIFDGHSIRDSKRDSENGCASR